MLIYPLSSLVNKPGLHYMPLGLSFIAAALQKVGRHFTCDINDLKIHPGTKLYREKGVSFFEENEWSEKGISSFYHTDQL